MFDEQKVTWSYKHGSERVVFQFNMNEMNQQEMFMMWVKFMNAVGYTLDAAEMEAMWIGE